MSLTFCNGYPTWISTALTLYDPNCKADGDGDDAPFSIECWWNIAPGSCAVVYGGDLKDWNRYWYYYAQADDGAVWSGPYVAPVTSDKFSDCWRGPFVVQTPIFSIGFRELDIDNYDDYTLTFIP